MKFQFRFAPRWVAYLILLVALSGISPRTAMAQQKGQWLPGQMGLNAGIMPDPGITYVNIDLSYSAGTLNDRNGNATPVTGDYSVWVIENLIYYVPKFKILGGNLAFAIAQPTVANGSLTVPQFGVSGGGYGFADTYVQPFTLGWHKKRADFYVAYVFFAPTGRYLPGATDNIGSGYWGNDFVTGSTFYLTKNRATTVNLFTDWEFHGNKQNANSTSVTPGQTFTTEWGVGQVIPLKKDFSRLLQLGGVGYDQWQVSNNGGTLTDGVTPASRLPYYSVHAAGVQSNFILPAKNLNFTFKYYWEYSAKAHPLGRTIAIGLTYTFRIPKPTPPPAPKS
jgi:hypothetical protein